VQGTIKLSKQIEKSKQRLLKGRSLSTCKKLNTKLKMSTRKVQRNALSISRNYAKFNLRNKK